MIARLETRLVVIDAQRAFVDPAGSLWRMHGPDEIQPGLAALDRLRELFRSRAHAGATISVRSEYAPGQFTGGDVTDGMAQVCVPAANVRRSWRIAIEGFGSP